MITTIGIIGGTITFDMTDDFQQTMDSFKTQLAEDKPYIEITGPKHDVLIMKSQITFIKVPKE